MTRQTLTDRQAANLGKTNLLDEQAATSSTASGGLLSQIKDTNKNLSDYKTSNDAAVQDAAKTATNFLEWDPAAGLTVRHESLPGKKVQITQDGIKVISGTGMVNIWPSGISITDGTGSCSIRSGGIYFHGIRNNKIYASGTGMVNIWPSGISITDGTGSCSIRSGGIYFHGIRNNKIYAWEYEKDTHGNPIGGFAAQTTALDLSSYSAVLLVYDTYKSPTWFASGGSAGRLSVVLPVNGQSYSFAYPWNTVHYSAVLLVYDTYKSPTWFASGGSAGRLSVVLPVNGQSYSFAYPWNTVHWRSVKVSATGVTFGPGKERTSDYRNNVITGVIHLEVPISDGVTQNNNVCRPLELYGFM